LVGGCKGKIIVFLARNKQKERGELGTSREDTLNDRSRGSRYDANVAEVLEGRGP